MPYKSVAPIQEALYAVVWNDPRRRKARNLIHCSKIFSKIVYFIYFGHVLYPYFSCHFPGNSPQKKLKISVELKTTLKWPKVKVWEDYINL